MYKSKQDCLKGFHAAHVGDINYVLADKEEQEDMYREWELITMRRPHIPYTTLCNSIGRDKDTPIPLICDLTFWKPTTFYEVKIPVKILKIMKHVVMGPKANKAATQRMDRVMLFISWLVTKHEYSIKNHNRKRKGIPVAKSKWESIAGNKNLVGMVKDILKCQGVVVAWENYNGKESYCFSGHEALHYSKQYYIPEAMMDCEKETYRFIEPITIEQTPTEQQEWLVESYQYIDVPTKKQVIRESLWQSGEKTKTGKTLLPLWLICELVGYNPDGDYGEYLPLDVHIDQYERLECKEPTYTEYGRMNEQLAALPGWIRDGMILIDNEPAQKCDFTALHHNLWMPVIESLEDIPKKEKMWWRNYVCGDGHTGLGKELAKMEGVPYTQDHRDAVKLESLSHYNTSKYAMKYTGEEDENGKKELTRMGKLFNAKAPTIWKWIRGTKKGPNGHCNTSRILTRMESTLIQECIMALKSKGIHCIYVHDCLMVSKTNYEETKNLMREIAMEMKIHSLL